MIYKKCRILFAIAALFTTCLRAQQGSKVGAMEIVPYVGVTFDLPEAGAYAGISSSTTTNQQFKNGRKMQVIVGGQAGLSLYKRLWAYGDYSYVTPDRSTATAAIGSSTGVTTTDRHYWASGGGLQLGFTNSQRVVPYVEIGLGIVHQDYGTTTSYTNVNVNGQAGNIYRPLHVTNDIVTPHAGAGIRWFVRERSGLKFAIDGYYGGTGIQQQAPGASAGSFPVITRRGWGRVTVGYFFRFGRH